MSCQRIENRNPGVIDRIRPNQRLHWLRRALQWGTIVLALIIPITGLFRIDPVDGAFVVLDRQIWFSDFYIVVGLWLALSCFLVMTYSLVGTAFCGWSCPQNTLSEWANLMTHKWLGKRAEVSLDSQPMQVSAGKNKRLNWLILGVMFMFVAMLAALIPMFYFYAPDVVWSFVTFRQDDRLAPSMYWIYTVFTLIIFLDIAFVRHFWCRFMCIYRVWQHSFKTRETLRVVHDKSQADECAHCNYCVTSCIVEIDPRNTETYDSCINCGECINACNRVRAGRKTGTSLLHFEAGLAGSDKRVRQGKNVNSVWKRAPWATIMAVFGLLLFAWGLHSYESYHISAYRAETAQNNSLNQYRINIANKLYQPAEFTVTIEGLPADVYRLSTTMVKFNSVGRKDVGLTISKDLPPGLHPLLVKVHRSGGGEQSFRITHYTARHERG